MNALPVGTHSCQCVRTKHRPRLVVLTGGPGGGKSAILELARLYLCRHVVFVPEAASIVFGGGFPRVDGPVGRQAAQRAIFRIQREMEELARANPDAGLVICDRGTIDGLAYWPGRQQGFFGPAGTSLAAELERYAAVVHVETPNHAAQYQTNNIRHENLQQAREIDRRIAALWSPHPDRHEVSSEIDFIDKASAAIEILRDHVPACCKSPG
ncbi:MAG: hypothetical protein JWN34_1763 [Bryobacterales bacterium]|nr:hypothetical protein [Bryobacterales bacterium]